MSQAAKKMGILVGGGPAPGINAVIGAATIRALLSGCEVVGIRDGFTHVMKGDIEHVKSLSTDDVGLIHFRGGSYLGIARANPTKAQELLETTVTSLERLGIDKLVTIGGDDTGFSASRIESASKGRVRVVHVPKTIDNDLDLPGNAETFGFQTARHIGVGLVENLMTDARTTGRWYFVVAMGRKAGHLAIGIGKAAGASVTLIPEEFPEPQIKLAKIVDTLVSSMVKRLADGGQDGVAVLAEGLAERFDPAELSELGNVERDAHGHVRLAEIQLGDVLKDRVQKRLREFGVKATIVSKNIGYELRCADPIPFDMEYSRDLGYAAAKYVIEGGSGAMVSMSQGVFRALPFDSIMDPSTGRFRVRMTDIDGDRYMIARSYMLRLRKEDLENAATVAKLAGVLKISSERFVKEFGYVVGDEPSPRAFFPEHAQRSTPAR